MSIGVSARTTKFAARNNLGGVRQESNPQSPTAYSSERYGTLRLLQQKRNCTKKLQLNG
jgi:hypothetical protein